MSRTMVGTPVNRVAFSFSMILRASPASHLRIIKMAFPAGKEKRHVAKSGNMEHGDCHESLRLLLWCQQGGKLSQLHARTNTPLCVYDTLGKACAPRGVHDHGLVLMLDVLV